MLLFSLSLSLSIVPLLLSLFFSSLQIFPVFPCSVREFNQDILFFDM